jgi:hypothetical protein
MAEENAQQSDTIHDPTIEDDLEAKEREFRRMTREEDDSLDPDVAEDEVENPENLLAQAEDPDAQES